MSLSTFLQYIKETVDFDVDFLCSLPNDNVRIVDVRLSLEPEKEADFLTQVKAILEELL